MVETPRAIMKGDVQYFELGDVTLESGQTLRRARLAYVTRGRLNRARDNAVLYPTHYAGTHQANLALVAPGRALDPVRYFIVVPSLFGNGESSSPSCHGAQPGTLFPRVTLGDNVRAHWRLLNECFGVEAVRLAFGWSMGAQQAYHHAALFPARVRSMLAVCGSARTSRHNWVFLEGVKAALQADPELAGGLYERPPLRGLGAFGRVYAGWAYSPAFFREGLYERLGHASPAALLDAWAVEHQAWDANDLLCMLDSWQHADISDNAFYEGSLPRALGAIGAKSIIMPSRTDRYFSVEDSEEEVSHLRDGELRVLESKFGHVAGGPDRVPADTALIEAALRDLLEH
jgi:homoserine O-acetyltransferase/O-succinyltransferase